jgi:hypothetical protein
VSVLFKQKGWSEDKNIDFDKWAYALKFPRSRSPTSSLRDTGGHARPALLRLPARVAARGQDLAGSRSGRVSLSEPSFHRE